MGKITKRLLAAGRREVTLPESGLEVRIVRAKVYSFIKSMMPLGSVLQDLSGAAWNLSRGEEIPDELACRINASSPTLAGLCERLLVECVTEMREPDGEWERISIVPDDQEAEADGDEIRVSDFTQGLGLKDVGMLQAAIQEHNGIGKEFAKALAPFRPKARAGDPPNGGDLQEAADGDPGAGPDGVHGEPGVSDRGAESAGGEGKGNELPA